MSALGLPPDSNRSTVKPGPTKSSTKASARFSSPGRSAVDGTASSSAAAARNRSVSIPLILSRHPGAKGPGPRCGAGAGAAHRLGHPAGPQSRSVSTGAAGRGGGPGGGDAAERGRSRWGARYRKWVPGDLLDVFLVVLAAAFAVEGYRQGFVVGALGVIGFLTAAAAGAALAPGIAQALVRSPSQQALVAIVVVFLVALAGQLLASLAGAALRSRLAG